jgi:hypothetical protein
MDLVHNDFLGTANDDKTRGLIRWYIQGVRKVLTGV